MENTAMIPGTAAPQIKTGLTEARRDLIQKRLRNALAAPVQSSSIPHRPEQSTPLLSFAQQRLWFIDQIEPGSPAYHVAAVLRLTGPLDVDSLQNSFTQIIHRHEILRTRFPAVDGMPVQFVEPARKFDLPLIDLTQLPAAERESRAQQHLKHSAQESFNLAQGPLTRE